MYLNSDARKGQTYDAIVVGSGISGGWAAKELCEKGLKVLLLERGRDQKHIEDYKHALTPPWELPHRNRVTNAMKEKFPYETVEGNYPITEANQDFWLPYAESPYQQEKPFHWFRGNGIGGKSLLWGRQVYRWSDLDFEANAKDGIAIDWPIRYKDIEPWYAYVEKFIGVSGEALNLSHTPDSIFQPAMELNCVEKDFQQKIKARYKGNRHVTIGRVAHLTQPEDFQLELGRASCQYRNACSNGCPYGAYFSTQAATLPAAMKTGNLTVRPFSVVSKVLYDDASKKAKGVEVIDANTMESIEFYAKVIFLNASTIGSTHVLLNSISDRFPEGMGNDSGQLGRNLMDHHSRVGASGTVEGFEDDYYFGRRANGIFIPRYRNIGNDKRDYIRGFDYQGGASRQGWSRMVAEISFGEDLKNELTHPGSWTLGFGGFGECLPYEDNRMTIHPLERDKFGMPSIIFNAEIKENEMKMREDMGNDAAEMLQIAGVKNVKINNSKKFALGLSKHEMGTARMGKSPKTSVLNAHNQVWGCENVFVTDGACMTSSNCVNPSLTYMALTARACDFAVSELKKLNL
ncbi:GMC family oxidoreductase [Emticicia sp. CRIBPO]|uniref:GMC oxidoreductase n=1 Tax=Emticicia sp. CRIBPO TaxID=2683258 RepID=UPI001412AAEC|nr:GMC family oxidoreductase [Emticicia sp. CRIBPO]NBA86993.1 GMC family oxidoreductase [Emticicia sp. CRIBPO]